jgi:hypothetical protein
MYKDLFVQNKFVFQADLDPSHNNSLPIRGVRKVSNVSARKKLVLLVIDSIHLRKGSKLIINPGSLVDSDRKAKDGIVNFGKRNKEFTNDFVFPDSEIVSDTHFKIRFNLKKHSERIKNIFGTGTFVKIVRKFVDEFLSKLIKKNNCFFRNNSHNGDIPQFLQYFV